MTRSPLRDKDTNKLHRKPKEAGRDDALDAGLEKQRLEPGLNAEGTGGAGANPEGHHEDSNSNT